MEFPFNVISIFGSELSLLDSNLLPFNIARQNARQLRTDISTVLDGMGTASAKAQGLHGPITGGSKLCHSDHVVYVKIDHAVKRGAGAVVGFLKIGCKKLFVFDRQGMHHEVEPLCILDFYVHESCQRKGVGKLLFDVMLAREGVEPSQLAIDRPSPKLTAFLAKHYALKSAIKQVNNFVVYEAFFSRKIAKRLPRPVLPADRDLLTVMSSTSSAQQSVGPSSSLSTMQQPRSSSTMPQPAVSAAQLPSTNYAESGAAYRAGPLQPAPHIVLPNGFNATAPLSRTRSADKHHVPLVKETSGGSLAGQDSRSGGSLMGQDSRSGGSLMGQDSRASTKNAAATSLATNAASLKSADSATTAERIFGSRQTNPPHSASSSVSTHSQRYQKTALW